MYVIPEEYGILVQAVLSVMDNICSYEELNFEYLEPSMPIELFPSHQQCYEYLDGFICLLLLPQTITVTKEAVVKPTLDAHGLRESPPG